MRMTSDMANKVVRELEDDKAFWINKENEASTYVASIKEEPVVPEYNYEKVRDKILEINEKICVIKHALNLSNATSEIDVNGKKMSVDTILIRMAQLGRRKAVLDTMRKREKKARNMDRYGYGGSGKDPEYIYVNYDLDTVEADYKAVFAEITVMQEALNKHNVTHEFDVDIEL